MTGALRRTPRPVTALHLPRLAQHDTASAIEHLEELRWRIVWSALSLAGAFVAAWILRTPLLHLLNRPLHGHFRIQTLGVTEPFFTTVTVAAHAALAVCFPVLLYHGYRFVSPALAPWQRRAAVPYLVLAPALFATGVVFCFEFVLGPAVRFLLGIGAESFDVAVRAQDYYSFVSTMLLAMGAAFLFPLVLVALGRLGVVRSSMLRRNRRYALLVITIVAALLPTVDPVSLLVEMLPLLALYELSIWLVRLQERAADRAAARNASA